MPSTSLHVCYDLHIKEKLTHTYTSTFFTDDMLFKVHVHILYIHLFKQTEKQKKMSQALMRKS